MLRVADWLIERLERLEGWVRDVRWRVEDYAWPRHQRLDP